MVNVGLATNAIVVASVLPTLGKLKLLKQRKDMHNFVLKEGLMSNVVVGSALTDMYANCGSIKEVESIFECMSDKDIMVWNSVIIRYNLVGDFESTFFTFRRIWGAKHRPNSITLVRILPICTQMEAFRQGKEIHGYVTKTSLGLNVSVGNSNRYQDMEHYLCMLDLIGTTGDLDGAYKFITRMHMTPDANVLGSLLGACRLHNKVKLA
ncbi:hypothetical protein JHK86_028235 [Glycine max]|nr:hypothetical protein JHK86_028235 [Glycine max]